MGDFVRILSAAAILIAASASADTVTSNGYSAAFPCQARSASQAIAAGSIKVQVTSNSCEKDGVLYSVAMSTYPQGFIAKRTMKAALGDAVIGAAANVKGTVRTEAPITNSGVGGRDAVIDLANPKAVARLRVFYVGDKQYQVMVITPKGQENGKAPMGFLGSFKLVK